MNCIDNIEIPTDYSTLKKKNKTSLKIHFEFEIIKKKKTTNQPQKSCS